MIRCIPTLVLAAACTFLSAQDAVAPRLAYFIPEQVIQSSVRGKKVFAEMEVLQKTLTEKLRVKGEELQKMDQQMKSPGLSDEGRAKIQRDFQDGETAYKRLQEDSNAEFRKVQEKCANQFNQEIKPIVDAVAKEWKLEVVLMFQPQGMVYADEVWMVKFSTEVAKRYDAKYESGAAPAEKAPAAASKPAPKAGKK